MQSTAKQLDSASERPSGPQALHARKLEKAPSPLLLVAWVTALLAASSVSFASFHHLKSITHSSTGATIKSSVLL